MEFQSNANTTLIPRAMWYKSIFSTFGIGGWLTWCAMVLALISTASIFPDFAAGGSIDLYLSRPISRLRLFLTKYIAGLLFVALQVAVFAIACFLVIGIRGRSWEPRIFLCVPLVVLVFSFLFSPCVLLGILTRSVIASLLLTLLFWLLIFCIDLAEKGSLGAKLAGQIETKAYMNLFAYKDREIALQREKLAAGDATAAKAIEQIQQGRTALEEKKRESDPGRRNWATAQAILFKAKSIFPKTSETNSLLDRWLNISDDVGNEADKHAEQGSGGWSSPFGDRTEVKLPDLEVSREVVETLHRRPVSWVLGTSIAFEGAMLALAAWIFCRRDY
jgi:hypothetical protein